MSGREQLIRDWWDRLAQSEAELKAASPHRRWIKRIYVRLFRFLLAMYGRGDWRADTTSEPADEREAPAEESHETHMELIDLRTETGGAPPKSLSQIRHALKTVQNAATEKPAGPHADGLQPEDWIIVASRRDGILLEGFGEALYLAGVPWRCRRLGRDTVLEVRLFHEEEALDLLRELGSEVHRARFPRRIPSVREAGRVVEAVKWAFLGAFLPFTASFVYRDLSGTAPSWGFECAVVFGTLVGGFCGAVIGSVIGGRRR